MFFIVFKNIILFSKSCSSTLNSISGFLSGGVVGNISQSTLLYSHFKSNSFSNYNVSGFCVAFRDLESLVSQCIDEECIYKGDNCSYCPKNYFNFSSEIENLNFSCIYETSKWGWKIENKTSFFIFIDTNFIIENTTFFDGNLFVLPNSTIIFNISDFKNVPFLNITGDLKIEGNIELSLEARPGQTDTSVLLFQYASQNDSLTGLKNFQIKLTKNYQDGKCDKIKHSVNDLPNVLFVQLKTNFRYCKKLLALILGLSLGIPSLLVLIAIIVLFLMRKKLGSDAKKFQKENVEMQTNKGNNSMIWNSNTSNNSGQKWNEFNQI